MDIAIISYYESDFKALVTELVENEGFASDTNYVWIKEEKNIPDGIKFDHVLVELGSEDMYSLADLEKFKSKIPLKNEKFRNLTEAEGQSPEAQDGTSTEDVRTTSSARRSRKSTSK